MLSFDLKNLISSQLPPLAKATRLYQLGHFQWALDEFERNPSIVNSAEGDLLHAHLVSKQRGARESSNFTLIWQADPEGWESDWILRAFDSCFDTVIVDRHFKIAANNMIVVCNKLASIDCSYFEAAFKSGCKVALIHLSDEAYDDDLSPYRWCDIVFRNYWSPLFDEITLIRCFPLGYKKGLKALPEIKKASARTHLWNFAGDPNKSDRMTMIQTLEKSGPGQLHLTSGFDSLDSLSTEGYYRLLSDSAFTPCPSGFVNVETFRIWEALECGSIPIIGSRLGFDYIKGLVGSNPLPLIDSWEDAAALINLQSSPSELDMLQTRCSKWWNEYKSSLCKSNREILKSITSQ